VAPGDSGADGMAIDSVGRRAITLAFSGPDKKTLYVPQLGAVAPDGKPWTTREGVRNTAMTIYKISMLAEGFKGRPK
jgi:gluconolactonase